MGNLTPSLAAETEALKEAYAALNRNDIPGFVKVLDTQIERVEPSDSPSGGRFHGIAAVTEHVSRARETWAEGTYEPARFITVGDKVIVFAHVHVRLQHEAEWREGTIADVFIFRNGQAILWRTFSDRQQALQWAGVEAPGANRYEI